MFNYCKLEEKILCISKYEYPFFLNKNNVLGLGLGQKIKNGFNTFKPCITVFVKRKLSANTIAIKDLIPSVYKGITTDVIESGNITPSSLIGRRRPVLCGYNISLPTRSGGSLGCLVADARFTYILSCNHVIAQNGLEPIGTPIIQPSWKFGGKTSKDTIANSSIFVKVKPDVSNRVDCAIGRITDKSCISKEVALLNSPIKGINDAKIGMDVQKVGFITERTTGIITVLGSTFDITMWGKSYRFIDQIWTTKMDDKGDSGSILLDMNMNAIGLLMASGSQGTQYNPIKKVLGSLNVEIITG